MRYGKNSYRNCRILSNNDLDFLSDYRKDLENEIPNFPETCKFHLKIIIAICSKQCLPLILIKHDNLDK